MAVNRFTNPGEQEYVSSRVPLPLELMGKVLMNKQDKFDKTLEEIGSSTDPLGKINVSGSLKTYGKSGIEDTDLGFQNRKNQLVTSLNAKRDALAEGLASGKIDPRDPSIYQLKRESLAAANELQGYSEIAKQVKANNDEMSKNKDYSKQGFLGNRAIQYNTDFLKDLHEGKATSYNPVGIAGYTNRSDEVGKYAKDVGTDQLAAYIGTDKRPGYIYEFSNYGKTKDKIESGFDNWYSNSIVKDDIELEVKDLAAIHGMTVDTEIPVKIPKYNDKNEFLGMEDQKMKFGKYYEALAKQNLLGQAKTQSTSKIDQSQSSDAWALRGADKDDEEQTTPVFTGATNVNVDPNYRADSPTGLKSFFKNFSLTKELYANLYPNEGDKTIDMSKPLSKDHELILKKVKGLYGTEGIDNVTKAYLINQYLDKWGKDQLNIEIDQYDTTKKVENENQIYFASDGKGAKAATTRKFTSMFGGEVGKEVSGIEFLKKYSDPSKYSINTTGKLNPDNPYYSAGRVVTISNTSGEVVAQYAMSGNNREMSGGDRLKHDLYKNLKYNPRGEYKTMLPFEDEKENRSMKEYTFEFESGTDTPIVVDGVEVPPTNGGMETLIVKDSKGKEVFNKKGYNVIEEFYKTSEEK